MACNELEKQNLTKHHFFLPLLEKMVKLEFLVHRWESILNRKWKSMLRKALKPVRQWEQVLDKWKKKMCWNEIENGHCVIKEGDKSVCVIWKSVF